MRSRVSENAQEVRTSIDALLHGVFEAFLVSATAIAIAMAITLIEKLLISSLYRRTEALAQRLDGLFEAGADLEHLERLAARALLVLMSGGRVIEHA